MFAKTCLTRFTLALAAVITVASAFNLAKFTSDRLKEIKLRLSIDPDVNLSLEDYLKYWNYPVQLHTVETEDGYLLKFYRLQAKGTNITEGKKVVYMQHGLISSSDLWVLNQESRAPALVLANKGYDVWLGNSRGNFHSRRHRVLKPTDEKFWDFTWDDMSRYDLPAAFKYIANVTRQKVNYVAHSQGTLIMFAALSEERKTVTEHLGKFIALAPIAFLDHLSKGILGSISNASIFDNLEANPYQEVYTRGKQVSVSSLVVCKLSPWLCTMSQRFLTGEPASCVDPSRVPYQKAHGPGGTSLKNVMHFEQMINSPPKTLVKFNHKPLENMKRYGTTKAPQYDLSKIKGKDISFMVGELDSLSNLRDVVELKNVLGSNVKFYKTYQLCHSGFVLGPNADEYIADMLKILSEDTQTESPSPVS